jgi:ATP-dependent Clp protease ATP-binding subunit ClpC
MLCQICKKRIASVAIKKEINGRMKTLHLCHVCVADHSFFDVDKFFGNSIFNPLFGRRNSFPGIQGRKSFQPERINIFDYFTNQAKEVVYESIEKAKEFKSKYVNTEHLLLGLLEEEVETKLIAELKIKPEDLKSYLEQNIIEGAAEEDREPDFSSRAKKVLELAFYKSREAGLNYVGPEHILLGLVLEGEGIAAQVLGKYGVSPEKMESLLTKTIGKAKETKVKSVTPTLDQYSTDLTAEARNGKLDPVIGRADEISRVIQVLSRRTKNNPVLIGEPGVGKTAIAEGLAQRIISANIPETLSKKRVIALDLSLVLSGTKYRGEFEKRIKKILKEIKDAKKDIILFIDELHMLVGAGAAEGAIDAANILKPSLARGELQAIGATTLDEYRKHIEKDAALERRFQPIMISEPSVEETCEILRGLCDKYEAHHKVKISDEALISAATLSDRYITDRFLPDKAVDLIDEAAAKFRLLSVTAPEKLKELDHEIKRFKKEIDAAKNTKNRKRVLLLDCELQKKLKEKEKIYASWQKSKGISEPEVKASDIEEIVASWTGIPVSQISEEEGKKLLKLEERLHRRVIGQNEAVKAVSSAIRRGRAGLSLPTRPIGSFIFLGPTGVGKTELAKALAFQLFGSEEAIIRFDMSEFMERYTVSKLVGSPPGYIGYDEGGQLTEKVRRKPYSVILLDEIEKAHPDVFNILLQILEDGRLTDAKGRTVDFKNTVLIATSNIGSSQISATGEGRVGFSEKGEEEKTVEEIEGYDGVKKQLLFELKKYFRPEFLNRIDEVIVFHALTKKEIKQIVDLMLVRVKDLLFGQNLNLEISEKAKEILVEEGFDPTFGARPLRRLIQKKIEDPLSLLILSGKFKSGDRIFAEVSKNNDFEFKKIRKNIKTKVKILA